MISRLPPLPLPLLLHSAFRVPRSAFGNCLIVAAFLFASAVVFAADPPPQVRRIPPPGIAVPEAEREELEAGAASLEREIDGLRTELKAKPELLALLPDVQIFHKAVDWALRYDEFFDSKQLAVATAQLALGRQRATELREGKPSWNSAVGLVVRGYVSKIDGSIQPYGLVIPEEWKPDDKTPRRLDFWLHGRAEKLSELAFIDDRMKNKGEFVPEGAFVLHLYGRYCNANKFAGEVDLFEALENAKKHYPIDEQRLVARGFSMGGASAWQFATHYPGMWAAAAPGAGFAETAEYLKVFAPGKEPPPWWEQVLWRWYDATLYAANLAHVPTVAYSGENDGQRQAAEIMIQYAEKEGVTIPHIIGPQTGHKYHPESKAKIEEFVTKAAESGAAEVPENVRFVTYSLVYPETKRLHRGRWSEFLDEPGFSVVYPEIKRLRIEGLAKHWERGELNWAIDSDGAVQIRTQNVTRFSFSWPAWPNPATSPFAVVIDGQQQAISREDKPTYSRVKKAGRWTMTTALDPAMTAKKPGLCGPIDHAFMSPFLFVRPTGKPVNAGVGAWAKNELEHAIEFWRRVFRGDALVKDDIAVTRDDIRNKHLILFGDPSSNEILKRMAKLGVRNGGDSREPLALPYLWTGETLKFGDVTYDAAHHVPILIFPNPLNPEKYVVLNSGPTFREQALLSNSDQTPKLPDWAIVDIRTPPGPKWPGLVVDAGFFDEQWRLPVANR